MKKIYAFLFACVVFAISVCLVDAASRQSLKKNQSYAIYNNVDERNACEYAMRQILAENALPVLGSSELSAADEVGYPPSLFQNGNADFNMVLIGRGYMQSLHQATVLGALSEDCAQRKVVLIVSPQWFTEAHLSSESYVGRFSERMYAGFLRNKKLSREVKEHLTSRLESLLTADPTQLGRVQNYRAIYLEHSLNPVLQIEMRIYDAFMECKQRFLYSNMLAQTAQEASVQDRGVKVMAEQLDFEQLRRTAQEVGEQACTNNEFYVYDEYFDTYIRENLEAYQNSSVGVNYSVSQEYDDLRLFLEVCRQTGIRPLVVSVPVNGRWYDWTGFSAADREIYYQNIRDICQEYGAELADFSDREYEAYFLKDIMHMGWKGWVDLDERVYQFYREGAQ